MIHFALMVAAFLFLLYVGFITLGITVAIVDAFLGRPRTKPAK
jgi:hypothetical protein